MTSLVSESAGSQLVSLVAVALASVFLLFLPSWCRSAFRRSQAVVRKLNASTFAPKAILPEQPSSPTVSKEHDFPEDWWTSQTLFDLEKRAIFSKTWLHVCHTSLFQKPGDYRTFSIAGFEFVLVLGKDRKLRAFHNICRHRAYAVCTKSQGSSLVMHCKYHGWAYDSTGKLIKAPKFDGVPGFSRKDNSLFEIRSWSDSSGFVYVNFDIYGSDGLTIRVGVPMRAQLTLVESWTVEADFNWKIAMSTGSFKVQAMAMTTGVSELLSKVGVSFDAWRWPAEFELSPLTRLLRSPKGNAFLTISIVPVGPEKCNLVCHLYSAGPTGRPELSVAAIKTQVRESVGKLQATFDAVQHEGTITDMQSQEPLLAEIQAHRRLERLTGAEVHPASRLREASQACKVADDLCKELEAAASPGRNVTDNSIEW